MKYLGNKSRLYDFLSDAMCLKDRKGQKALDLFSGTGAVSTLFKKSELNTVSNDFLSFSYHRTKSILLDEAPPVNDFLTIQKKDGFITKNYSESSGVNIFKTHIASHIDGARTYLRDNRHEFTPDEFSYYLAQVIEAADFRSNIMGSYESYYKAGWRNQCEREWQLKEFELQNNDNQTSHNVYNEDACQFLRDNDESYDFIYLDPPYNARQYSSVFHVLETISKYNNPEVSGVIRKSVDVKDKKSNFSSKRKCRHEMEDVIGLSGLRADEIFISYSNEGILSLSDIESLLKQTYSKVIVHKLDYRRFKTNSRKQNSNNKVKEFLFNGIK